MKPLQKRNLAHLTVLLLLVVIVAWPFLSRPGLPRETDAELHVFRLAELARLISRGELYPRWAPNFYFGYGYPIFNYYAPLSYYLGLPMALIPGLGAVAGAKLVFVLTYLAGALGIFGFVRRTWGSAAGVVSAAAYVFAPYLQYADPYARGDLAEFLSFGLFPLALWSLDKLRRETSAGAFLASVLTTGLMVLSHNLMALVFFGLLSAWFLWQCGSYAWRRRRQTVQIDGGGHWLQQRGVWLAGALALAVMLTAFFWLPVALEQDAVNLSSLIGDGGHFDFRNHFLGLSELFGPARWLDWRATEPEFMLNLGMAQWLLALLGVVGVVTGYARERGQAAFFAIAAMALITLMTHASAFVWEAVPLMPYLQFPWRLLGPAAALLAILAGAGVQSLASCLAMIEAMERQQQTVGGRRSAAFRRWAPAVFTLIILLQALPLAMVPPWSEEPWETSAAAVMAIERQGRWVGTTSTADFVPRTVEVIPSPRGAMFDQLVNEGEIDRVNRATLPEGTVITGEMITPLHTRYHVSADNNFLLRLFLFDFPGWEVHIDGREVETVLARPEGFIAVPVPGGEHVLDVNFVETVERRISWSLSGAGLILVVLTTLWLMRKTLRNAPEPAVTQQIPVGFPVRTLSPRPFVIVITVYLALFAVAHWQGWFHHRSEGLTAIPAENDTYASLGGQIALIGFDAPAVVRRGSPFEVTLYWKAETEIDISYQVFLHLLNDADVPVAQSDKLNPGDFPTRRWPTDKYVRDVHRLQTPESAAPGVYQLSTGMWVQSEGWRLPLLNEHGEQAGDSVFFAQIELR